MNSYTFMGLDDVEEGEEISSRKKSFIKRAIAYIKIRREASRVTRNNITRDRAGTHERLLAAFFTDALIERSLRMALDHFCQAVMEIYGPEFLRRPTVTDIEIYASFLGMLGSLNYLWIWHAFFGVAGSNNDINVSYQSPLFNDLKTGQAPEILFVANGVTYRSGYYLVDEIYPELDTLVKRIPESSDDDHKRILYKQKQESARKDVEWAFGVRKKKWAILANPTRALRKYRIVNMMYTCIILHNMIRKYKKVVISPRWFPEEAHQPEDMLRNEEQVQQVMRWIRSSQVHQNLRHDLIEHLAQNA
ncbi:ALP1-like protein [Tanacetum coccineum]